jgi:hypothetical protein
MNSKLTINIFEQAAERFTASEAEVLQDWCLPCNCPAPGEIANCQNCPYFRELVQRIQENLNSGGAEVFPMMLPPEITAIFKRMRYSNSNERTNVECL